MGGFFATNRPHAGATPAFKQALRAWLALMAFIACGYSFAEPSDTAAPNITIIPKPVYLETVTGSFRIGPQTYLLADADTEGLALLLAERLRRATGYPLPIHAQKPSNRANPIELRLAPAGGSQAATHHEGYELRVRSDAITILSQHQAGLFYGVQTLLQLLPPEIYAKQTAATPLGDLVVPNLNIADYPRFAWRGLMIDVSRHFFSKQQLLKTIDAMAMHKLNILHLHLTDDPGWRIQIDAYPKLTHIGAIGDRTNPDGPERLYFSKDDIRELVAHAESRHIQVIPEIDMPGHSMAAARAYPEYFDGLKTFNPANPDTYTFVTEVLQEVMELFPAGYLHFGGDEVRDHRWAELPEMEPFMREHGYSEYHEVEGHFDRFVANFIVEQGFTPIGWDEVTQLDVHPSTIVQWWLHLRPESRDLAIKKGHRVIISPTNYLYFDYPNGPGEPGAPWEGNDNGPNSLQLIHQWEPIPEHYSPAQESLVLGLQANLWSEFIRSNDYFEYMIFPRVSALAEIAWSPKGDRDLDNFVHRLGSQCLRYQALGLNYRRFGEWPVDFSYLTH